MRRARDWAKADRRDQRRSAEIGWLPSARLRMDAVPPHAEPPLRILRARTVCSFVGLRALSLSLCRTLFSDRGRWLYFMWDDVCSAVSLDLQQLHDKYLSQIVPETWLLGLRLWKGVVNCYVCLHASLIYFLLRLFFCRSTPKVLSEMFLVVCVLLQARALRLFSVCVCLSYMARTDSISFPKAQVVCFDLYCVFLHHTRWHAQKI